MFVRLQLHCERDVVQLHPQQGIYIFTNPNLCSRLPESRPSNYQLPLTTYQLPITNYQLLPLSPKPIPLIPPRLAPLMLFMDLLHVIRFLFNGGFEP